MIMTLGEQVGSLRRTLRRALVRRLAPQGGRTLVQLLALRAVARNEVRTQAELADRLSIDAPAVSRLVGGLEAEGLLRRLKGPDRRSVRLQVTAAARPEIAAIAEALRWLNREARQHLTHKEFESAMALMQKLQAGMTGEKIKPAGL